VTGAIALDTDDHLDFFRILASPGDEIVIDLKGAISGVGTLYDPYLSLYDRNGTEIAYNDDIILGEYQESRIIYSSFAYAGAYYVVADSYGSDTGTYLLQAVLTSPDLLREPESDYYVFQAETGTVFSLSSATPGDGPYEPDSVLDPILELQSPNGTVVATDDNSAADGRNALLTHTAEVAGMYRVGVVPAGLDGGPYLLRLEGILRDSDTDGLPDLWERGFGLDYLDDGSGNPDNGPAGDGDGDHSTNEEEWFAGTRPDDPDSLFEVESIGPSGHPLTVITVSTEPERRYVIEYSDGPISNDAPWSVFVNPANGAGTWMETGTVSSTYTFTDDHTPATSGGAPVDGLREYRIRVEQP
jgi:hypothetical protein